MSPIPKDSAVRQVVPVITGTVEKTVFNEATGQLDYLVAYVDADGHPAERWFSHDQLEVIPATPAQVKK